MNKVVFLRHGDSLWDQEQRYEGWLNSNLSTEGMEQARVAGQNMRNAGMHFDLAFTSTLDRAIRSLWIVQEQIQQMWMPVEKDWRLNDRHFGCLQGLTKAEIRNHYGQEQIAKWHKHYRASIPTLTESDPRHPVNDLRYQRIQTTMLPNGESLQAMCDRVVNFWEFAITPWIKQQADILIVAHEATLKAIIRHLGKLYEDELTDLHIPSGVPLVYEFNEHCQVLSHYYLQDENAREANVIQINAA